MSKSKNTPNQNATTTEASEQLYHIGLLELKMELDQAANLSCAHRLWIKKCYREAEIDQPIANAIRIVGAELRQSLERARGIADTISEQDLPGTAGPCRVILAGLEDIRDDGLKMYEPLPDFLPREMLALLFISSDFAEKLHDVQSYVESEISRLAGNESLTGGDSNRDQADSSDVDSIPSHCLEPASKLDLAYTALRMLTASLICSGGKNFINCPDDFRSELKKIADLLADIEVGNLDADVVCSLCDAMSSLNFVEEVFKSGGMIGEYWKPVHDVLEQACEMLGHAARVANRFWAEEVLKAGRCDAEDTVH